MTEQQTTPPAASEGVDLEELERDTRRPSWSGYPKTPLSVDKAIAELRRLRADKVDLLCEIGRCARRFEWFSVHSTNAILVEEVGAREATTLNSLLSKHDKSGK